MSLFANDFDQRVEDSSTPHNLEVCLHGTDLHNVEGIMSIGLQPGPSATNHVRGAYCEKGNRYRCTTNYVTYESFPKCAHPALVW